MTRSPPRNSARQGDHRWSDGPRRPHSGAGGGTRGGREPGPPPRDELPDESKPHWLWGLHAARAALANPQRQVLRVFATRNAALDLAPEIQSRPDFELLDPDAISGQLPPGAVHQGLAVFVAPLDSSDLSEACAPPKGLVAVLDQVTDPQNVGAIFRSAAAFGARAVVMQDRKSPPLTGALAKAAVGAVDIVAHVRVVNVARAVEALAGWGYLTVGLSGDADAELSDVLDGRPVALVLGSEGKGLRPGVAQACAVTARIPIGARMESLNVSNAAAIAFYEAARSFRKRSE